MWTGMGSRCRCHCYYRWCHEERIVPGMDRQRFPEALACGLFVDVEMGRDS